MKFESPEQNSMETPEDRFDQYHQESLAIAQELSRRWMTLREEKKKNPNLFADDPFLEEIDAASRPPKSGIQVWFESKLNFVNTAAGNDPDARSRMLYRVKEDLERVKGKVDDILGVEDKSKETDRKERRGNKDILRRSDIDESKSRDLNISLQALLKENGFKAGDKVVFFAEREREGVLEANPDGSLKVRDTNGNPNGILGIMMDINGYIRRS